jgi:preprotein translocase subunit SecE
VTDTRGATATPERDRRPSARRGPAGWPARVALFYRQVVSELRKVVWPTREQLLTYTAVVLVFVAVIIAIVTVLDLAFGRVMFEIFG